MIVNKNALIEIALWTIVFVIMHSLLLIKTVIWLFPVLLIVKLYASELVKDIRQMLKDAIKDTDHDYQVNSSFLCYNVHLNSTAPNNVGQNFQPDTTKPNIDNVDSNVFLDSMAPSNGDASKQLQTDEYLMTLNDDQSESSILSSEPSVIEHSTINGTPNAQRMTRKKGQSGIPIRCTIAKVQRKNRKSRIPVRAATFNQVVLRRLTVKQKLIHVEELMDSIGRKNIYRDDLRYHCLYNQLRIEFNLLVDKL